MLLQYISIKHLTTFCLQIHLQKRLLSLFYGFYQIKQLWLHVFKFIGQHLIIIKKTTFCYQSFTFNTLKNSKRYIIKYLRLLYSILSSIHVWYDMSLSSFKYVRKIPLWRVCGKSLKSKFLNKLFYYFLG